MSKRMKIELLILLIVIVFGILWFKQDLIKTQISSYYYQKAITAIRAGADKKATGYVLKGIAWDPYPGSKDYQEFQKIRSELKQP